MPHMDEAVLLASGARTTTQTLGPNPNPDSLGDICGIEVVVDLTTFTTAASLTTSIEEYVEGKAGWVAVLTSAARTANGTDRLRYRPTAPEVANQSTSGHLARQYRVVVTHGNANSHTYSVTIKRIRDC